MSANPIGWRGWNLPPPDARSKSQMIIVRNESSIMRYAAEVYFVMLMPKKLKNAMESELDSAIKTTFGACCTWYSAWRESSIGLPFSMICCSATSDSTRKPSPHNPSFPTATSAGTLNPVTNRSSRHICSATKSCESTTSTLPSIGLPPASSPPAVSAEAAPTVSTPATTNAMANQWKAYCLRLRYTVESSPVKTMLEPRSIW
mmetsp:Transcript_3442/g.7281  ORF Transcript_3442/g.7281 Transcript_3442/m.7281 type:complete len:203 (+) Transcript_3442:724-1332(+)